MSSLTSLSLWSSPSTSLLLDPSILYWVLSPIFIVMVLQGIIRNYLGILLKTSPSVTAESLRMNGILRRAQRLRANGMFLPPQDFHSRKTFFIQRELKETDGGDQKEKSPQSNESSPSSPPGGDPFAMVGMMKQNMAMVVPNMLLMGWVSFFFSGFVVVKFPFGLTERFKSMLQRGVMMSTLDVSYVSSLSWYFILFMGLRGIFLLLLGAESAAVENPDVLMAQQMANPMAPMANPTDFAKVFQTESNELEIHRIHQQGQYSGLMEIEQRILYT